MTAALVEDEFLTKEKIKTLLLGLPCRVIACRHTLATFSVHIMTSPAISYVIFVLYLTILALSLIGLVVPEQQQPLRIF